MLRAGFWIIDDRIDAAVLVVVHGAFVGVRAGVDGRAWHCVHVIDCIVEILVKFLDRLHVLLILRWLHSIRPGFIVDHPVSHGFIVDYSVRRCFDQPFRICFIDLYSTVVRIKHGVRIGLL